MSFRAAAEATGGILLQAAPVLAGAGVFEGVSIDSRQVEAGQAYVAIAGERFDGHQFCNQAARRGAALLVVSQLPPVPPTEEVPLLQVEDTRHALGLMARWWRQEVDPQVAAITGSVGKTTTKELTRGILSRAGAVHCSPGNFNNDIGLPLTLLSLPADADYLVAELGMNHAGEIETLARLAEPDVGLITCVAPVHLEGLGSIEAVAAAKAELLQELCPPAIAVVPGDEPLLAPWVEALPPDRLLRFGSGPRDDVRIEACHPLGLSGAAIRLSLVGERVDVRLPLVGEHNARNAAAAAAVGVALGISSQAIAEALSTPLELEHRSIIRDLGDWKVYDDCYNANPVANEAALATLVQLAGERQSVAVLGEMLELGEESDRLHRDVGAAAAAHSLGALITVGPQAAAIARGAVDGGMPREKVIEVEDAEQAATEVARRAKPGAWVLVKASRGAHLEKVIEEMDAINRSASTNKR